VLYSLSKTSDWDTLPRRSFLDFVSLNLVKAYAVLDQVHPTLIIRLAHLIRS
jgi:hypothetical protein